MKKKSKDLAQVEIDGTKRKIVFHGDCLELLAVCRAMCCREWEVSISPKEYASGRFNAEAICLLTDKICSEPGQSCINLKYRLCRLPDKSCVYLQDDHCRIYAERPRTCRVFQCKGGWRLTSVYPAEGISLDQKPAAITQETF